MKISNTIGSGGGARSFPLQLQLMLSSLGPNFPASGDDVFLEENSGTTKLQGGWENVRITEQIEAQAVAYDAHTLIPSHSPVGLQS